MPTKPLIQCQSPTQPHLCLKLNKRTRRRRISMQLPHLPLQHLLQRRPLLKHNPRLLLHTQPSRTSISISNPIRRASPNGSEDDSYDGYGCVYEDDVVDDEDVDFSVDDYDLGEGEEDWEDEVCGCYPEECFDCFCEAAYTKRISWWKWMMRV